MKGASHVLELCSVSLTRHEDRRLRGRGQIWTSLHQGLTSWLVSPSKQLDEPDLKGRVARAD